MEVEAQASPKLDEPSIPCQSKKSSRCVKFFSAVSVVLIPSVNEYKEAMLFDRLWWTKHDFRLFENNLVDDVKSYMGRTACMDYKIAMRMINSECDSHFNLRSEGGSF